MSIVDVSAHGDAEGGPRVSVGKTRALMQLATTSGVFAMVALDHGDALASLLVTERSAPAPAVMTETKLMLCRALAPASSAVLLDPIYGAAQAIVARALPGQCGLIVTLEDSGYEGRPWQREGRLIDGWSVRKTRLMGAQAVKLLAYYNPEDVPASANQRDMISDVAQECQMWDIPLLVEPILYPTPAQEVDPVAFAARRGDLIIETAREVTALGVDLLKAEFPAPMNERDQGALDDYCRRLDAASAVPWIILSAGVTYSVFRRQVETACRAGASGFLAGRSIWGDAVTAVTPTHQAAALREAAARVAELRQLAEDVGWSWERRMSPCTVEHGWHRSYAR